MRAFARQFNEGEGEQHLESRGGIAIEQYGANPSVV